VRRARGDDEVVVAKPGAVLERNESFSVDLLISAIRTAVLRWFARM
jgi:hypothetical protein